MSPPWIERFEVEEIPLYRPAGEGEHTFVWIEKRDRTTEEVARALARAAGVSPAQVGYAGRKDRRAIARQWLSVPGLEPERALALELEGARVLEARRHRHRLRTGQLHANRFRLRLGGVTREQARQAAERACERLRRGMPNRFGPQRFGADGRNAERGRELLTGERTVRNRREARFLLSALQAAVFNRVLAERPLALDRVECGDIAVVHATGGLFRVEDPEAEKERVRRFEISPTGPIFGTRMRGAGGAVGEREREALRHFGLDPGRLRPPRGVRLRGARRPLRVRPEALELRWLPPDRLELEFALAPGSYASVLVEELIPSAWERR